MCVFIAMTLSLLFVNVTEYKVQKPKINMLIKFCLIRVNDALPF